MSENVILVIGERDLVRTIFLLGGERKRVKILFLFEENATESKRYSCGWRT